MYGIGDLQESRHWKPIGSAKYEHLGQLVKQIWVPSVSPDWPANVFYPVFGSGFTDQA